MKRSFLFTIILILFFNSCEKEIVYEDYQSNILLRQVRGTEGDMEVITYYNTGYIFEHVQRFSYRKFLYNKQNQLIKIEIALSFNPLSCAIIPGTTFEDGDDPRKAKIGQYMEYEYSDNGNLKIKNFYYENDDKNNPFKIFAVEGTPGSNTNKNNITKQTTINYYAEEEQSYTVEYSYEYNDLGYPVKANSLEYIYGEGE